MSFGNQALWAEFFAAKRRALATGVHDAPLETDREVARLKLLAALGTAIDVLTPEQVVYAASWVVGT